MPALASVSAAQAPDGPPPITCGGAGARQARRRARRVRRRLARTATRSLRPPSDLLVAVTVTAPGAEAARKRTEAACHARVSREPRRPAASPPHLQRVRRADERAARGRNTPASAQISTASVRAEPVSPRSRVTLGGTAGPTRIRRGAHAGGLRRLGCACRSGVPRRSAESRRNAPAGHGPGNWGGGRAASAQKASSGGAVDASESRGTREQPRARQGRGGARQATWLRNRNGTPHLARRGAAKRGATPTDCSACIAAGLP